MIEVGIDSSGYILNISVSSIETTARQITYLPSLCIIYEEIFWVHKILIITPYLRETKPL